MIAPLATPSVVELELQLLLEAIYRYSGYDFRDYAPSFVKRRISERVRAENARTVSGLQEIILHDSEAFDRLIFGLSVGSSELFGDPTFFSDFRRTIVPMLRTFPFIRIWIAGCGRGEDVYSLAILLHEEGLYRRCRIYATDISPVAVGMAKEGQISIDVFEGALQRYRLGGGEHTLENFLAFNHQRAAFDPALRENVVFSTHNLASDGSFNEFNVIVCRNAMMQFNRGLAYRAHQVVFESLMRLGYLALGPKENLRGAPNQRCYEPVDGTQQIYRRVR